MPEVAQGEVEEQVAVFLSFRLEKFRYLDSQYYKS
jgi:hypothetical protein